MAWFLIFHGIQPTLASSLLQWYAAVVILDLHHLRAIGSANEPRAIVTTSGPEPSNDSAEVDTADDFVLVEHEKPEVSAHLNSTSEGQFYMVSIGGFPCPFSYPSCDTLVTDPDHMDGNVAGPAFVAVDSVVIDDTAISTTQTESGQTVADEAAVRGDVSTDITATLPVEPDIARKVSSRPPSALSRWLSRRRSSDVKDPQATPLDHSQTLSEAGFPLNPVSCLEDGYSACAERPVDTADEDYGRLPDHSPVAVTIMEERHASREPSTKAPSFFKKWNSRTKTTKSPMTAAPSTPSPGARDPIDELDELIASWGS